MAILPDGSQFKRGMKQLQYPLWWSDGMVNSYDCAKLWKILSTFFDVTKQNLTCLVYICLYMYIYMCVYVHMFSLPRFVYDIKG